MEPEIFMPHCDGNLATLSSSLPPPTRAGVSEMVLKQMLSALDFLTRENLIHRDIKPENILYDLEGPGKYRFQLADFGLATWSDRNAVTICGTPSYQAPEVLGLPQFPAPQSTAVDIWSLFATIVAVDSNFCHFPPTTDNYRNILAMLKATDSPKIDIGFAIRILKAKASRAPQLEQMVELDPKKRPSAAELLIALFGGEGRATKRSPTKPESNDLASIARPSNLTQRGRDKAPQRPLSPTDNGLIVYPPDRMDIDPPSPDRMDIDPPSPVPLSAHRQQNTPGQITTVQPQVIGARPDRMAKAPTGTKAEAPARKPAPSRKPDPAARREGQARNRR